MSTEYPPRRAALVEIPAPQPKITARIRRSYLEILGGGLPPSPPVRGRHKPAGCTKRTQSVDVTLRSVWAERIAERCDKMEPPPTHLARQQVAQFIRSLIVAEQSQEARIVASDLKCLQEELQLRKATIYRSIPYSRLGSNRDAHCYRKAYPHIVAFKVSCQEWSQVLLRNKEWDAVLEHTLMAWRYVSELPQWDTANHNTLREQCYSLLAANCLSALQHYQPDASRGRELLRRLKIAQFSSQSIAPCIQVLQRIMGCASCSSLDVK